MTRRTMSKTCKIASTAVLTGALAVGGAAMATPAMAAPAAAPAASASGAANVNFDPVAIGNAIRDAVNDQDDRGGAVRAALDVASAQSGVNVAVANKNQDVSSSGEVWAEHLDIKGGSYVVYFYDREGSIENNGDGGWINWGFKGTFDRDGQTVTFH